MWLSQILINVLLHLFIEVFVITTAVLQWHEIKGLEKLALVRKLVEEQRFGTRQRSENID